MMKLLNYFSDEMNLTIMRTIACKYLFPKVRVVFSSKYFKNLHINLYTNKCHKRASITKCSRQFKKPNTY